MSKKLGRLRVAAVATLSIAGLGLATTPTSAMVPGDTWFPRKAKDVPGVQDCDSRKSIAYANERPDVRLGVACYEDSGDIFWVRDRQGDGYRVVAYWVTDGTPVHSGNCSNLEGAAADWTQCNYGADALPEGDELTFQVRIQDGHEIKDRGAQRTTTA